MLLINVRSCLSSPLLSLALLGALPSLPLHRMQFLGELLAPDQCSLLRIVSLRLELLALIVKELVSVETETFVSFCHFRREDPFESEKIPEKKARQMSKTL